MPFFYAHGRVYCKIHIFLEYARIRVIIFKKTSFCKVELAKYTFFAFFCQKTCVCQIFFVPLQRI